MIVSAGQTCFQPGDRRPLHRHILEHRLDDHLRVGQRLQSVDGGRKSGQRRLGLLGGELALRDTPARASRESAPPPASSADWLWSQAATRMPAAIRAWAMPVPIVPMPKHAGLG